MPSAQCRLGARDKKKSTEPPGVPRGRQTKGLSDAPVKTRGIRKGPLEKLFWLHVKLPIQWTRNARLFKLAASRCRPQQMRDSKQRNALALRSNVSRHLRPQRFQTLPPWGDQPWSTLLRRAPLVDAKKVLRSRQGNEVTGTEPGEQGDFWALKDVSFDIEQGKTIGLIGANGAGKSTLLKIISRITAPTKGSVKIKGSIGNLLEVGTGFHPELTGRDNVFLYGAILGMNRAEVKSKFDDIVGFAELQQFIDTPIKRYSNGMYVRLAFAVSAFLEAEILILDEVLGVGDIAFRTKCYQRLEELIRRRHTILFVGHDSEVITRFCDSAVWLHKGSVQAYGPAELVANDYKAMALPEEYAEVPVMS